MHRAIGEEGGVGSVPLTVAHAVTAPGHRLCAQRGQGWMSWGYRFTATPYDRHTEQSGQGVLRSNVFTPGPLFSTPRMEQAAGEGTYGEERHAFFRLTGGKK